MLRGQQKDHQRRDRQRAEHHQGEQRIDDQQHHDHRQRDGDCLHQLRDAVRDEVLQRLHVAHRARDQSAGAAAGEEAVRELLQVAVDPLQQVGQQSVGGLVRGHAVQVAGRAAQQEHRDKDQHDRCQRRAAGIRARVPGSAGDVRDQAAHVQRGHQRGGREQQAAGGRQPDQDLVPAERVGYAARRLRVRHRLAAAHPPAAAAAKWRASCSRKRSSLLSRGA